MLTRNAGYKDSAKGISAVFPAFNEEMNIGQTVRRAIEVLPQFTDSWEVIVVDDGSVDGTAEIVRKFCNAFNNISLIRHEANRGYGAALGSGITAAKKDLVFFCDSDLQFDLGELGKLLEWIDSYDIVAGYRINRQDPFHRKANAFAWNTLVKLLLGFRVKDVDCAFKLFRRSVFDRINIEARGAMVNTDILAQAAKNGNRIKEVGVNHFPRMHGNQTGAKAKVVLRAFAELIRLYHKLKEHRDYKRVYIAHNADLPAGKEHGEALLNISERGASLITHGSYRLNEIVELTVDGCETRIKVPGRVLRATATAERSELAVEFTGLDRQTRSALKEMLAALEAEPFVTGCHLL